MGLVGHEKPVSFKIGPLYIGPNSTIRSYIQFGNYKNVGPVFMQAQVLDGNVITIPGVVIPLEIERYGTEQRENGYTYFIDIRNPSKFSIGFNIIGFKLGIFVIPDSF